MRIDHDPERGCASCPLRDETHYPGDLDVWIEYDCRITDRRIEDGHAPAPEWCPLRVQTVIEHDPDNTYGCADGHVLARLAEES